MRRLARASAACLALAPWQAWAASAPPTPPDVITSARGALQSSTLGQPSGPASLSPSGTVPASQLPIGTGAGQVASGPDACSISGATDCSGAKVTAAGGTPLSLAAILSGSVFGAAFGMKCDSSTSDAAALQNAINQALTYTYGATVVLPRGRCVIPAAMAATLSGNKLLHITGQGQDATELMFTTDADAFNITMSSSGWWLRDSNPGVGLQFDNLSIVQAAGSSSTTRAGISVVGDSVGGRPAPAIKFAGLTMRGTSSGGQWGKAFTLSNATAAVWKDVSVIFANQSTTGDAITVSATGSVTGVDYAADNLKVYFGNRAVVAGDYIQGFRIENSALIGQQIGVDWEVPTTSRQSGLHIMNSHINAYQRAIKATYMSWVQVLGNNIISNNASSGTCTYDAIEFGAVASAEVLGNSFVGSGCSGENGVYVANGGTTANNYPIVVNGNSFTSFTGTGILTDGSTSGILATGNGFNSVGTAYSLSSGKNLYGQNLINGAIDSSVPLVGNSNAGIGSGNTLSGIGSFVAGINNTAGGSQNAGFGNNVQMTGQQSLGAGISITSTGQRNLVTGGGTVDRGRFGVACHGSNRYTVNGDTQECIAVLGGATTSAAAVRLTSDGAAAGSANVINLPSAAASAYSLRVQLIAVDRTNPANTYSWSVPIAILQKTGTANSTAALTLGTPVTLATNSWAPTVSATADTTNGGLNITFTPPSGNTDTINVVARIDDVEAQ